jgi:hypothetical protein
MRTLKMNEETITLELTPEEAQNIVNIYGNIFSAAYDAEADPGIVEIIYYKALNALEMETV